MSSLCWVRRDLRLHDHAALSAALEAGPTTLVFVFDTHILNKLKDKGDRRVTFIHQSLCEMESELQKKGSSLIILYGKPEEEIPKLASELKVTSVYCNRDYEPYAKKRDSLVAKKIKAHHIEFHSFKDHVMYEAKEVLTQSGGLYKVFTPYKNKWIETFEKSGRAVPDYKCHLKNLRQFKNEKNILKIDWLETIGFVPTPPVLSGGTKAAKRRLKDFAQENYEENRNFPALEGTSLLSVYLRFGNISIRDLVRAATSSAWLTELIWRDFYQMILDTTPRIEKESFKPEYDKIKWVGKPEHFKAWCEGQTGFPIVDAAMRCLNQTGLMHNRLRMITASFLCKILLLDWRSGEHYFAEKLLDFDLAANNGGWQWSSSSGCDAQPYFRIFNPYTQTKKFDPQEEFIQKWIPELHTKAYPNPIVSYEKNRERCLMMYAVVKSH